MILCFIWMFFVLNKNISVFADDKNATVTLQSTSPPSTNVYCEESKNIVGKKQLTWKKTPIGTPAYPNEFCSDENGIIPHRECHGDYNSRPGKWSDVVGNCSGNFTVSNITDSLHQILIRYAIDGLWDFGLLANISKKIHEYTCIDLYLLSKALYYMTIEEYLPPLLEHFSITMNNTLEIFTDLNESCQAFNASSYILGAINVFFNRVTEQRHNLKMIVTPNFVFQMSNPFVDDIIGLGLYKNEDESFINYTIKKIFKNESYDDIPTRNLQLAAYVPNDLFSTLSATLTEEDKLNFHVIIVAIRNNKLFNVGKDTEVVSKVIGLSISGFCNKEKVTLFDIYSKPLVEPMSVEDEDDNGEWFTVNNDDIFDDNALTECNYPPVTYMFLYDKEDHNQTCKKSGKYPYAEFSVRESKSSSLNLHNQNPVFDILSSLSISINYAQPQTVIEALYKRHRIALKTVMLVGCTLSLFGLLATILTLIFVKNWHRKRMYTIQLEIAMGFETFLFLIDSDISYITYIILYYFILSQFSWMMLIGYAQYVKFVKVFNDSSSNVIKSLLIGWVLPAFVIVIPIAIHPDCLYCEFCSAKRSILIYSVIVPTSVIILINITVYLLVMFNISKSKGQKYGGHRNSKNIDKRHTRTSILLPFMLGITWIFIFALVSPWRWFSLAGSYLFHIIAPAQAFVLFVFVVPMDKNTRKVWCMHWESLKGRFRKTKEIKKTHSVSTITYL